MNPYTELENAVHEHGLSKDAYVRLYRIVHSAYNLGLARGVESAAGGFPEMDMKKVLERLGNNRSGV